MEKINLTETEIQRLLVYARPKHYPDREIRRFNPKSQLGHYFDSLLIACDVDNAVLVFKDKQQPEVPHHFASVTAISYNPRGEYDENWVFNPNGDTIHPQLADVKVTSLSGLDRTRSAILTSMLGNQAITARYPSINRLIQCDLCAQPSPNSRQMPIQNKNVSSWTTIKHAMDKSQIIFLGWGNGPYQHPGELMNALQQCDKFDVTAFYTYLKARVAKQQVYTFQYSTKTYQPVQPAAHVAHQANLVTIEQLNRMFNHS